MKINRLLWLLTGICFAANGQTLDSLKNIMHESGDAFDMYQVGSYFYGTGSYDSALYYYNLGLKSPARIGDRASLLNGIGVVYSAMGSPERSVPYYRQAISLFLTLNDTANVITAGYNLAIIYKDLGLYDEALEISFNALPKLERQPPSRTLASSYNTIGTVYTRIEDYEKAYTYYRKALQVRNLIKYEQGVGQSYNNIGELFIEMNQFDSALSNLQRAAEIRKKINDNRGLGRTLSLIGTVFLRSGKFDQAKGSLTEALKINRASSDNIGEVATLNGLGVTFLSLKNFRLAEANLDQALSLINRSGIKEHLKRNLELHAAVYRATNDRPNLIETLERILVVKDSLLNVEKVESLVALEVRYESQKKEQEIDALQQQGRLDKAELEAKKFQVYALLTVMLLIVVIAFLGYRVYKQSRKEKLSAELHTKEVQHRMKNHLQILSSLFTIQASLIEDKQAQELVKSTEGRVTAMALLHKKLYNRDNSAALSLREYVVDLTNSILFAFGFDETKLTLDLQVQDIDLPVDKTIRIGLILNELITNALKHAYAEHPDPRLTIKIVHDGRSTLLVVHDNGNRPLASITENKASFGLRMVRSIVKELKGKIELTTENGTRYQITIP